MIKGKKILFIGLGAVFALAAGNTIANATIDSTSGTGRTVPIPADLEHNSWVSDDYIFGFNEQQNITLTGPMEVDNLITSADLNTPLHGIALNTVGTADTDGNLAAGVYSSHLIHFDPATDPEPGVAFPLLDASFTFDGYIVALIFSNEYLLATDTIFGSPGTTYRNSGYNDFRRTEYAHDTFQISSSTPNVLDIDKLSIGIHWIDEMRVITAASPNPDPVPEPATMLLFGTGLMGLIGASLRKKNK